MGDLPLRGRFQLNVKADLCVPYHAPYEGEGMIPIEQIAFKDQVAIDGVIYKELFYDNANILYCNAELSSTDAANCYDAVSHPICSLALQSMGLPAWAIITYLRCL